MSPRNRNAQLPAPEAHPHQDQSHGVGFGWYSLPMCDYSGHWGPRPRSLLTWTSPSEACWGHRAGRYICIHAHFPLLLNNHIRVTLEGTIIHHGHITGIITL